MKLLVRFFTILIIAIFAFSCGDDDEETVIPNVTFKATLKGTNEVPSNASTAIGLATLTYNPNNSTFTIEVTHDLVAATGGHIHKGATGINGEVVFPFLNTASPINFTSVALTASQLSDLNAGLLYVNLHTASFPGGEIRGQILRQ